MIIKLIQKTFVSNLVKKENLRKIKNTNKLKKCKTKRMKNQIL